MGGDVFFFYGTLLDGSNNPVARDVHRLLEPQGAATVSGTLYGVPDEAGWFPALLPGRGVVHGRLYAPRGEFSAADLARLDAYEDYDPLRRDRSLYVREAVRLGTGGAAQAYIYNQLLPDGSLAIPGGDFRTWLAATGLAQFTGLREA